MRTTLRCLLSLAWVLTATTNWAAERGPVTVEPEDTDRHATSLSLARGEASPPREPSHAVLARGCPITALPNDATNSGNARAPNLRVRFVRAHYLILPSEMAAAGFGPGTSFASIGWTFTSPPGLSGSGPLIVYMENTSDTSNNKSATWATAITGMTVVHNANTTIPNAAGSFDIVLTGGGPFSYTGGGLYVAFDFQYPVGTLSTTTIVLCNSTGLLSGLIAAQSNTSPPTTLTASNFRPETRLAAVAATIFNEASVDHVFSYGAVPRDVVGPQFVRAVVTNRGANALTNIPVTLTVTGANSHVDTQTISSLASCGGREIVNFTAFSASTIGTSTLAVTVPNDDVPTNNSRSVSMDVTPARYSFKYPGSAPSGGVGFNGATAAFVGKFTTSFAVNITGVELEFATVSATTYRVVVYKDSGSGTPGPLHYVDGADRTVAAAGPITIPIPSVSVGPGDFFVGIHQTNTTLAGLSYDAEFPVRNLAFFIGTPVPVGTWFDFSPTNNYKLNIGVTLDPCVDTAACDDANVCTSEACDTANGCTHANNTLPCDDQIACSPTDTCTGGVCIGARTNCYDRNVRSTGITFTQDSMPGFYKVDVAASLSNNTCGTLDLSTIGTVFVNGNQLEAFLQVDDDNQGTCGGFECLTSCNNDCPAGTPQCRSIEDSCLCMLDEVVITPNGGISAGHLGATDLVRVDLTAAPGAADEYFTETDTAERVFAGPADLGGLLWTAASRDQFSWNPGPGSVSYTVYRGDGASLAGLTSVAIDSCKRSTGAATTTGQVLTEVPAVGSFFWYVVTSTNSTGLEGLPGYASNGPRQLNSSGSCP